MTPSFAAGFRNIICALCLLGGATSAIAQTPQPAGGAREGGFIGVTVMPGFTFDGETFDGRTIYQEIDGDEVVFLPELNKRPLIRAILGYRARNASLEISYDRTQHDGTFVDVPLDATYQAINADGRFFFNTSSRVQPHILLGASFPWFNVKDGSFLDPDSDDARFKGYGLNTEAGVTIYPTPRLGLSVGYAYRLIWFDRVTGVTDTLFELRPRFRETAGTIAITGTLIF